MWKGRRRGARPYSNTKRSLAWTRQRNLEPGAGTDHPDSSEPGQTLPDCRSSAKAMAQGWKWAGYRSAARLSGLEEAPAVPIAAPRIGFRDDDVAGDSQLAKQEYGGTWT